jgi:anti-anti-sigma factor
MMPASPLSTQEPSDLAEEHADFAVALSYSAERAMVAVRGHVDVLTAAAFGAFLDVATARVELLLVVDLAELEFIDCSGLGHIARAYARLQRDGGEIAVVSASPIAYKLFEIAGFTQVMRVERMLPAVVVEPEVDSAGEAMDEALAAALSEIVDRVGTAIASADGASVSLEVRDGLATVAASDEVIAGMDADQYSLGQGPCVSAATVGEGFSIESMSGETRWPAFAARAYQRGIHSVISTPLFVEGRSVGALNIYSRTPHAFALRQGGLAWQLAGEASAVLAAHAGVAGRSAARRDTAK